MENIGDRIKSKREAKGLSAVELARLVGVTKQAVGQWESGASKPAGDTLVRLAEVFGVSERWFVTGRHGKLISSLQPSSNGHKIGKDNAPISQIDEVDVRAAAGGGTMLDGDDSAKVAEWAVPTQLVRVASNAPAGNIKILTVVGDSMPSSFRPYDKVMVDTLDKNPTPPGIFVVWEGLGLVVKRVMAIPHSDPPKVRIISENPDYPPYERTLDEAYIQGRVLGKWLWV